jgi:hypothetical protein
MPIQKIKQNALWLNGWGLSEDGRLVYLPLYDPPKALTDALKFYFVADFLRGAATAVSDPEIVHTIKSMSGAYVKRSANAMDADTNPCGTPWGHPHIGPHSPLGTVISEITSDVARNSIIGMLIANVGKMVGDKDMVKLGGQMAR